MIDFFPSREVVVQIAGFSIRWYGLLYVVAFWLAFWLLPKLAKYRKLNLTPDDWAYVVIWAAVGVLAGGRLGYVFFYEPIFFFQHPAQILALWNGGMSSHGGFIGVALALWHVSKKLKIHVLNLADLAVVPVTIGLALGRIGNFINQELYPGHLALGVAAADALIGLLCFWALRQGKYRNGQVLAIFLVAYSIIRFLNEYVRIQEWPYTFGLTRGQLLTVPIFIAGIYFWTKKSPVS